MIYRITKPDNSLKGTIHLTASKSESNRALLIRALCDQHFEISNLAAAKDTQTLQALLASKDQNLDVGPAGTTMRFLTAYLSQCEGKEVLLSGSERMHQRPIGILVNALQEIGANIKYLKKEGYPPLQINGQSLAGGTITIDGSVSSQFITALLLIAPKLEKGLALTFNGPIASRPYLEMTLNIMRYFGVETHWSKGELIVKPEKYTAKDFEVEADWSAASYWYQMAAFADELDLTIYGLRENSLQGDSVVANIYEEFGVHTEYINGGLRLTKSGSVTKTFNYDFDACPDVAQTLACTCAAFGIEANFSGLQSLRIKETDRSLALQQELKKFETTIDLFGNDRLSIQPSTINLPLSTIETYEDHRMAMAFAPLAMKATAVEIADPEVVDKSYPDYWADLKKVGFQIEEI
jgi:3-phosphoshikimate 1-carboxyvinyltransferase